MWRFSKFGYLLFRWFSVVSDIFCEVIETIWLGNMNYGGNRTKKETHSDKIRLQVGEQNVKAECGDGNIRETQTVYYLNIFLKIKCSSCNSIEV